MRSVKSCLFCPPWQPCSWSKVIRSFREPGFRVYLPFLPGAHSMFQEGLAPV